jgi:hypothetical protein
MVSEVSSAGGVGPMTTSGLCSKARDVFRGRNRADGAFEEIPMSEEKSGALERESVDRSGKILALSVVFLGLMSELDEGLDSTNISTSSS